MTVRRTLPLLDLDPDLGQLLPADRRESAHAQLQVDVHRLPAGPWNAGRLTDTNPEHVGLLLLEGVVSREVVVADTVSTELLGPGDVVRPWAVQEAAPLLQLTVRWNALTESRVAVLDRRFGARLTQFPEVNSVLIDRLNDRAQRLATTQAISQLNRVDRRLVALFWHLAERWGRMTPDGVLVPLTLSHRMLGQLVGARRPTVSTAIGDLARREELIRRPNGTWLLKGDPFGIPSSDAQRVIPIRRKLLGREPAAAALENGRGSEEAAELEVAAEELRSALVGLHSDAETDELDEITAQTRMLRRHSAELRELHAQQRWERSRREQGPPASPDSSPANPSSSLHA
jgi:hypothetical protein